MPDPTIDPPRRGATRGLGSRVGASVIDQALSTGTNLFITLFAARFLDLEGFGAFSVAYLISATAGGVCRSALGSTALVFQDDVAEDDGYALLGGALGTGLATSGLLVALGIAVGGALGAPLLVLALVMPGLLLQDAARLIEFALLRPGRALALDVIWAVALAIGLVATSVFWDITPAVLVAVWGGSGTISAAWALWTHGRRIPRPTIRWYQRTWSFGWRYLVVFVSTLGVFQVTTLILGGLVGVTAVGAVRATQVLFGPIQNLATGLMVAFVPELTGDTDLRAQRGRVLFVSGLLAGVAVAILVVGLLLPTTLGEAILGRSWPEARALILPAGFSAMLFGVTSGAVVGLRAARAVSESMIVGLQISGFQFAIPVVGALLGDEQGYMWSLVLTWIIGAALWWRCYRQVERASSLPAT